jgi:hypothetical protein
LKGLFEANHLVVGDSRLSVSGNDCLFVSTFCFHSSKVMGKPMQANGCFFVTRLQHSEKPEMQHLVSF